MNEVFTYIHSQHQESANDTKGCTIQSDELHLSLCSVHQGWYASLLLIVKPLWVDCHHTFAQRISFWLLLL